MIVGIGADMVSVQRIEQSIRKFEGRFLERIYTDAEQRYAREAANSGERFAARFAAKEAGFKALGGAWSEGFSWLDFEVRSGCNAPPELHFHGAALRRIQQLQVARTFLSLTHTAEHALAFVVLET